jgi:hypothetical protein
MINQWLTKPPLIRILHQIHPYISSLSCSWRLNWTPRVSGESSLSRICCRSYWWGLGAQVSKWGQRGVPDMYTISPFWQKIWCRVWTSKCFSYHESASRNIALFQGQITNVIPKNEFARYIVFLLPVYSLALIEEGCKHWRARAFQWQLTASRHKFLETYGFRKYQNRLNETLKYHISVQVLDLVIVYTWLIWVWPIASNLLKRSQVSILATLLWVEQA